MARTSWEVVKSVPRSGYRLLKQLSSKGSDKLQFHGGQALIFEVKNANVLGTTYQVTEDANNDSVGSIILPHQTVFWKIAHFGNEPMFWRFGTSTNSDACLVLLKVWSTWAAGMPPNR